MKIEDTSVCKACHEVLDKAWIVCPGCGGSPSNTAVPLKIYQEHFQEIPQ